LWSHENPVDRSVFPQRLVNDVLALLGSLFLRTSWYIATPALNECYVMFSSTTHGILDQAAACLEYLLIVCREGTFEVRICVIALGDYGVVWMRRTKVVNFPPSPTSYL